MLDILYWNFFRSDSFENEKLVFETSHDINSDFSLNFVFINFVSSIFELEKSILSIEHLAKVQDNKSESQKLMSLNFV